MSSSRNLCIIIAPRIPLSHTLVVVEISLSLHLVESSHLSRSFRRTFHVEEDERRSESKLRPPLASISRQTSRSRASLAFLRRSHPRRPERPFFLYVVQSTLATSSLLLRTKPCHRPPHLHLWHVENLRLFTKSSSTSPLSIRSHLGSDSSVTKSVVLVIVIVRFFRRTKNRTPAVIESLKLQLQQRFPHIQHDRPASTILW
jgi:hypothetical protein